MLFSWFMLQFSDKELYTWTLPFSTFHFLARRSNRINFYQNCSCVQVFTKVHNRWQSVKIWLMLFSGVRPFCFTKGNENKLFRNTGYTCQNLSGNHSAYIIICILILLKLSVLNTLPTIMVIIRHLCRCGIILVSSISSRCFPAL